MPGKILIVEDEREQAKPFYDLLKFRGDTVFTAENGVDAMKMSSTYRPELVIVDLLVVRRGDVLDGYHVIEKLRSSKETNRSGILAWTSHYVREADHIRALRLGADDFVTKDIEFGVLEARIEALLRRVGWGGNE